MSHPIGPKLRQGPFPGALLLDSATEHTRALLAPLDQPGPSQRDEVIVGIEQRTTGAPVIVTLDMPRAATIVQWLNREPGKYGYSTALSIVDTGPTSVSRDILTLVRTADVLVDMPHLTISIEHWTAGMVRKYREFELAGDGANNQIGRFYDWLRAFRFDGLPGVPRRRPDEGIVDFKIRANRERTESTR